MGIRDRFTDEDGMNYVTEDLGFIAPFKSFGDRTPADPLALSLIHISEPTRPY